MPKRSLLVVGLLSVALVFLAARPVEAVPVPDLVGDLTDHLVELALSRLEQGTGEFAAYAEPAVAVCRRQ